MKNKFNYYLKNGLSEYDKKYLNDFDYVMLLNINGQIKSYFANFHFMFFVEYPVDNKDYDSPDIVLNEEMDMCNSDAGVIYENKNGVFKIIAYSDRQKKKRN